MGARPGDMFTAPPDGLLASIGVTKGTMIDSESGSGEPMFGITLGIVDGEGDHDLLLMVPPAAMDDTADALEQAGRLLRGMRND